MIIQAILHATFEPTGVIQDWANQHGHQIIDVHPYKGEKLLKQDAFDALIIMGGPQTPRALEKYPYLKDEIDLIKQTIDSGKKVLGFCLGAQLIGESLGARTERSPQKEIGVWPITLTEVARDDVIFRDFPETFDVMHWHNDMPGIPEGAQVLSTSAGCPRQIVRFKDHVYGFQCHPEMSINVIQRLLAKCKDDLTDDKFVQSEKDILIQDYDTINQKAFLFLDRFF
ncbi:MAG: homoserine O-succinyltransferase [Gammaproteobacteria bacterium]|nr:homoserine O-succinyltransferase [Gammaproteobacteria bacterium]MCH9743814.1 homoserine O-succinyltransferase [Gammaproteobacteria bacterium]